MALNLAAVRAAIEADPALVQLADVGDDAGVAAALNEVTTECDAPAPVTVLGVLGLLSEASLARLSVHPSAPTIRDDVVKGDRAAVGNWAMLLAARPDPSNPASVGTITPAERDAVISSLSAVTKHPCTPAELAGALGDVATAADVNAALTDRRVERAIAELVSLRWPTVNVYIPPDAAAAAGLTDAHAHAAKMAHEGTVLGIDPDKRADAIALVAASDPALGKTLSAEASADDAARAAAADAAIAAATATPGA